MNPVSVDMVDYLESYGDSSGFSLSLAYAKNLFIGTEPKDPIDCVTIYDTSGFAPDLNLTTQGYEKPSIQIRVRNKKYTTAMSLAEEIKNALHGQSQVTLNGTLYSVIYCTSGPALLDYDNNGNARVVINFNLQRRVA